MEPNPPLPAPGEIVRSDERTPGPGRWSTDVVEEREMRLRDYWEMVRRHLWLVALTVAVITLPVAVVVMLSPDFYSATARIEIDMERRGGVGDASAGRAQTFISNDPAYFNTQLQLMSSSAPLRRAVRALDLDHNEAFARRVQRGG